MPRYEINLKILEKESIIIGYGDRDLKVADMSMNDAIEYRKISQNFDDEEMIFKLAVMIFGLTSKEDKEWLMKQSYKGIMKAIELAWEKLNIDEELKKKIDEQKSLKS